MIAVDAESIRHRCQQLASQVSSLCAVDVVACQSQVGGGSVPGATIDSYGLKISVSRIDQLAYRLRMGTPAVQGRVTDDSLVLDLRTVNPDEMDALASRISESIASLDDHA